MTLFKKKKRKKDLEPAINIKTLGNTVYLDFNGKTILKTGTVVVNYNTETPDVSLFNWHIGYKKEKKWWMIFRKRICGVQIEGDDLIVSGRNKDNTVLTSEEYNNNKMPTILYDLMKINDEVRRYLKNNFIDGYNKGIMMPKTLNKNDRQQQNAENIINQLRGYFQAEGDEQIKNNAMRMLDELEMILKA